jgi:hypothetical protein
MNNTDHTQPWENPCAAEGLAIPASYKTPVMLPIYSQDVLDTTLCAQYAAGVSGLFMHS